MIGMWTLFATLSVSADGGASRELPRTLREEFLQEAAPASPDGGPDLAELAKKLSNPVAALISIPVQGNVDFGGGPDDGDYGKKLLINIQPVIPISLSQDWNVISRTIVPLVAQEEIFPFDPRQSGLGDILQSAFLSPKEPGPGGVIWGVGPVILFPTATDDLLGAEKWGIGPTIVTLKQTSGWTFGVLWNHVWAAHGDEDRNNVSATFLQPFLAYAPAKGMTVTLNTESTYDWKAEEWTVPVNLVLGQVIPISGRLFNFQIGGRYYAETPDDGGPEWGLRFAITLLLPN